MGYPSNYSEQYFPITLGKVVLDHSNKFAERYFPVVLFIMLYKVVQVEVVLTLESVREIL